MKPKVIPVLENCIQDGIAFGWSRAHKHVDQPSEELIKQEIENQIWHNLYEAFEFEVNDYESTL
jgi:hypothetical protein